MSGWRQGDLLTPEHAVELGLVHSERQETCRAVVISHSCDIAKPEELEPNVEVIVAAVVQEGTACNGQSIVKLHVPAKYSGSTEWLELLITEKQFIDKTRLLEFNPWAYKIPLKERGVLQRWLAQRYSRSAFPDQFNKWLNQTRVEHKLARLAKKNSEALIGIYFDLDDDSERTIPQEPYELGVQIVYASDDAAHAVMARSFASSLKEEFERKCIVDGHWKWIELLYCDAISDQVFSLFAANTFRRFRLEHRSIDGEPLDESNY